MTKDVLDAWGECAENIAASMEAMEAMLAVVDEMMAGNHFVITIVDV